MERLLGVGHPAHSRPEPPPPLQPASYISTGVRGLDAALGGGVPRGAITEFYGEYGAGKTQLVMQLSVMAQRDGRVIYVDTEGTFRPERVVEMAAYRGMEPRRVLEGIEYARAYTSMHLAALLETAAEKALDEGVVLVAVDEVSSLPRREESGRGRVEAFHVIVGALKRLASLGLAVAATRQVVTVGGELRPAGGAALDSYAVRSVFLEKHGEGVRRAVVVDELGYGRHAEFLLSEGGAVDL